MSTADNPVEPTSGDQSASGIALPVSLTTPTVTTPTVPLPIPNPLAPQNTAAPVISGTTVVGKTLSVSNGTWYNASSYAYQWQDCNGSGAGCTPINGATSNAYTLGAGDANHTIRAVVTASNLLASSTATSNPTAVVTQPTPPPPPPPPPPSSCFSSPSSCGYPSYSGGIGANCSSLPVWSPSNLPSAAGSVSGHQVTITANNVTISGYNIGDYFFYVEGSHFTLNNDCISFNANDWSGGSATATSVWGTGGSSYLTVTNSTIVPPGCSVSPLSVCTSSNVNQTLITSGGAPYATIKADILAGAVEDLNSIGNNSTIQGNYILANGNPGGAIHSEALFEQDVTGLTIDHNVLLNPMEQSAVIFAQIGNSNGPCDNQFTITNNLIAGGGWPLSLCTHAGSAGTSSMTITGNHFARCSGNSNYDSSTGGRYCGTTAPRSGASVGGGADSHGYWPNGGFFGLTDSMYCTSPGWTWSNNVWDDNGAATSCS